MLTYKDLETLLGLRRQAIQKHIDAGRLGYRTGPKGINVTSADVTEFLRKRAAGEIKGPGRPRKAKV